MAAAVIARASETVTWVRVPPPTLDLVGVVLGAFSAAGVLAVSALVLGGTLGGALIYRSRRRMEAASTEAGLLGLTSRTH
ncbi:MAG: hypothetical protein HY317_05285 [Acidobacteria bacterium]|nr:hypothetical protein [Acidobacteriota bacterium]